MSRPIGDALTGPSGLLKDLTKMVLEISLEEEMTEYLGRGKHESPTPCQAGTMDHAMEASTQRVRDVFESRWPTAVKY